MGEIYMRSDSKNDQTKKVLKIRNVVGRLNHIVIKQSSFYPCLERLLYNIRHFQLGENNINEIDRWQRY
jgi:hypothetical protein